MVGSEVYSSEVKKTEVLMENFRRAIGALSAAGGVATGRAGAGRGWQAQQGGTPPSLLPLTGHPLA